MPFSDQINSMIPAAPVDFGSAQAVPQQRTDFWALLECASFWLAVLLSGLVLMLAMLLALQRTEAQSFRDARLVLALQEMRESLESELALGLDLADIGQTRNLLEKALNKDSSLLSADVMDAQGLLLFSTDRGSVGESVPLAVIKAAWQPLLQLSRQQQQQQQQQAHWFASGEDDRVLGLPIRNSFAQTVGFVSVTTVSVETLRPAWMFWAAIALFAAIALLAWLAAWLASCRDDQANSVPLLQQAASRLQATRLRQDTALARLVADQEQVF